MLDVCCLMRSPSSAQDITQLPNEHFLWAGCPWICRVWRSAETGDTPKGIRHNGLIRPHQGKMVVSIPALRPHSNDTYPKDSETKIRPRFTWHHYHITQLRSHDKDHQYSKCCQGNWERHSANTFCQLRCWKNNCFFCMLWLSTSCCMFIH